MVNWFVTYRMLYRLYRSVLTFALVFLQEYDEAIKSTTLEARADAENFFNSSHDDGLLLNPLNAQNSASTLPYQNKSHHDNESSSKDRKHKTLPAKKSKGTGMSCWVCTNHPVPPIGETLVRSISIPRNLRVFFGLQ